MDCSYKADITDVKPQVAVLTLAVPDFDHLPPAVWFTLLEIELHNRSIVDDTARYNQLVPRLPRHIILSVQSLLLHPPTSGKYEALKAAVLTESAPSNAARLEELLRPIQLGDRKPSTLLREMQASANVYGVTDTLLQELWLRRLPEPVQTLLAASPAKGLIELAASADAVLERMPTLRHGSIPGVMATHASHTSLSTGFMESREPKDALINALRLEVEQLRIAQTEITQTFTSTLNALRQEISRSHRGSNRLSRSSSRGRHFSSSPHRPKSRTEDPTLCWYHSTYGDAAKNCRLPCAKNERWHSRQGNAQVGQ